MTCIDCHHDNNLIVTGSTDVTAKIINTATGKVGVIHVYEILSVSNNPHLGLSPIFCRLGIIRDVLVSLLFIIKATRKFQMIVNIFQHYIWQC